MSNLAENIFKGMMGAFLQEGVRIEKLDMKEEKLYISLPERSDFYKEGKKVNSPKSFARRIKETFIEMGIFSSKCEVKYRTRDEDWTKEMGDKNFKENISHVLDIIRSTSY